MSFKALIISIRRPIHRRPSNAHQPHCEVSDDIGHFGKGVAGDGLREGLGQLEGHLEPDVIDAQDRILEDPPSFDSTLRSKAETSR